MCMLDVWPRKCVLGVWPRKFYSKISIYITLQRHAQMFITALFIIAKNEEQSQNSSMVVCKKKIMAYSHNGMLQSNENEWRQLHGIACMNLTNMILSKRNPTYESTYYLIVSIRIAKFSKTKDYISSYMETKILKEAKRNLQNPKFTKEKDSKCSRVLLLY